MDHKYSYDGPVTMFGNLLMEHWKSETIAISEKKARSNLTYQFKKKYNYTAGAKIELPGDIKLVN